jgi:renalase
MVRIPSSTHFENRFSVSLEWSLNPWRSNRGCRKLRHVQSIIVIGAGLSGIAAATDLQAAGKSVTVLEKSRGISGRSATRRWDGAVLDHGAPFFTARGERFTALAQTLEESGAVRVWTKGFHHWQDGQLIAPRDSHRRYIVSEGMNALAKSLRGVTPFTLETGATVTGVEPSDSGWMVTLATGETRGADAVIVTAPTPQALNLTRAHLEPATLAALERVSWQPCWALLAQLSVHPKVNWRGVKLTHPILEWAALEHTKRESSPALVLHANPAWSAANLERTPEEIAPLLQAATLEVFGSDLGITQAVAHRWRYARADTLHPAPTLEQDSLIFCGDWCDTDGYGTRVENAVQSGWAAASSLMMR